MGRIVAAGDFADLLLALPGVAGVRARRLWTGAGLLVGITILCADGAPLTPGSALDRRIQKALQRSSAPGTSFQIASPRVAWFGLHATLWTPSGAPATRRQSLIAAAEKALGDAFGATGSRLAADVTAAQVTSVLQSVPGVSGAVLQSLHLCPDRGQLPLTIKLAAADVSWDPETRSVLPAELLLLDLQGGVRLDVEGVP